jgi:outer membrane protein TolC
LFSVSLLSAHTALAQTPLALTLEDAIARGVAQAPRLAEARAREAAAAATVMSRAALGTPSVTAMTSYVRTNHVDAFGIPQSNGTVRVLFPDIPDNYRVRTELDVPIYTAGRTAAAVESAQADVRAAQADARVTEEDVRLDVIRAYWNLVTARETTKVLEASLQRMDAWVGDVQSRVTAGVLPPNDLLSAQAQRAHQNVQLIQARHGAAIAEVDLDRLIGADLDQPIVTTTTVDQPISGATEATAQPTAALVSRARESRSERTAIQDRQAGLRSAAAAALAGTRPQVGGIAAVEPSSPNQRFAPRTDEWKTSWDLGINVNWPLWDGGRARADHAASLAQADALGHRLDEFDAQVAVEVRQRLQDLAANRAALEAAGEGIAAAEEARRVIGERFNAGVATATDMLDAQNALLQAELERTQISAALRLGEARLLRAIGGL